MDNAGWHASRRAQRNSNLYEHPQRGPDGLYQPVEQVQPISEGFIGGFNIRTGPPTPHHLNIPNFPSPILPGPSDSRPPTPPSKEGLNGMRYTGEYGRQISQHDTVSSTTSNGRSFMSTLSAVERSQYLRAVRMNPYLQLMVGPLLRYDTVDELGVWHGACLIVSSDASSYYDPHPTLTYEWDPMASMSRSISHFTTTGKSWDLSPHPADPHSNDPIPDLSSASAQHTPTQSSTSRRETVPGHEIWVYEDPRGRTFTFWRFLIRIPLSQIEMPVRYSINNGQSLYFFVPALGQNMNVAAYSCNGFSAGVNPDDFRGPGFDSGYDPVWVDLLKKHDEKPFHVLVGGGDQIYCDGLVREPEMQEWLNLPKPDQRIKFQITTEMRTAIDRFYFNHYCRVFQSGAFARSTASIPMLNMADDHDLIDGYGSYPEDLQTSSVFSTIGARGYFFFLLFQCFVNVEVDGLDDSPGRHTFKSTILGQRGSYIPYPSHSALSYLGPNCFILMLDCRAERRKDQVCSNLEYKKVFDRLNKLPAQVQHLVVQIGIPIAYPRLTFMESFLDSKLNPLVALGKRGNLKGFVNKFNAEAELLDDLNDHWTAKGHKAERNEFVCRLQEYAQRMHTRVTFLSGDVHCAAVGVFKTHVKDKKRGELSPGLDFRYMLNIVSSAIVNTPPPNAVLSLVTNRASKEHKTLHHRETDEAMIPVFTRDTDGSTSNSRVVMGRRNWCKVFFDVNTRDLVFELRVEKEKGMGTTVGYDVRAPAPHWR